MTAMLLTLPSLAVAQTGPSSDATLLGEVVALGGGPDAFSARTLRERLGGSAEDSKLVATFGSDEIARFDTAFTFIVQDALRDMKQSGAGIASPTARSDGKTIANALFARGEDHGQVNVEMLFDAIFTPAAHMQAMMDVARRYGPAGETASHEVFARLIADVGGNGASVAPPSSDAMHMDNMHMDGMNTQNMGGMQMNGMPMPSPSPRDEK